MTFEKFEFRSSNFECITWMDLAVNATIFTLDGFVF